ncbi:hypothetical protein, partial [Burkholderia pseudomallei]|uniref:hypothetical protein n=1 Tax=Burkholderia pseudomallei TaxID=28450 RepID=UPI00201A7BD5
AVLASRPFRASLSSAQDHEHDISNAPPTAPVYTVSNFNSLLDALRGKQCLRSFLCRNYTGWLGSSHTGGVLFVLLVIFNN